MRTTFGNNQVITYPITGSDISSTAAITADMIYYVFSEQHDFNLSNTATPVSATVHIKWCNSAGVITGVHARVVTPGSSASVTVDVKKNGTTILSSPITLTNSSTANTRYDGTVSVSTFNADDYITAVLTVSSSTGMQGVAVWVNGYETSKPQ